MWASSILVVSSSRRPVGVDFSSLKKIISFEIAVPSEKNGFQAFETSLAVFVIMVWSSAMLTCSLVTVVFMSLLAPATWAIVPIMVIRPAKVRQSSFLRRLEPNRRSSTSRINAQWNWLLHDPIVFGAWLPFGTLQLWVLQTLTQQADNFFQSFVWCTLCYSIKTLCNVEFPFSIFKNALSSIAVVRASSAVSGFALRSSHCRVLSLSPVLQTCSTNAVLQTWSRPLGLSFQENHDRHA